MLLRMLLQYSLLFITAGVYQAAVDQVSTTYISTSDSLLMMHVILHLLLQLLELVLDLQHSRQLQCHELSLLGDRSFAVAGPRAWNKLPPPLRCVHSVAAFKRQLKTFLYNHAFN